MHLSQFVASNTSAPNHYCGAVECMFFMREKTPCPPLCVQYGRSSVHIPHLGARRLENSLQKRGTGLFQGGCFAAATRRCLWSVSLVYVSCICLCPVFFRLQFTHRSYIYIFARRQQGHANLSKYAGAFRTGSCSSSPPAFFHHMSLQKGISEICGGLNFSYFLLTRNLKKQLHWLLQLFGP